LVDLCHLYTQYIADFNYATIYTTTLHVHQLLTTSTLHWRVRKTRHRLTWLGARGIKNVLQLREE